MEVMSATADASWDCNVESWETRPWLSSAGPAFLVFKKLRLGLSLTEFCDPLCDASNAL